MEPAGYLSSQRKLLKFFDGLYQYETDRTKCVVP
jgi:hypothetical protein